MRGCHRLAMRLLQFVLVMPPRAWEGPEAWEEGRGTIRYVCRYQGRDGVIDAGYRSHCSSSGVGFDEMRFRTRRANNLATGRSAVCRCTRDVEV